VSIKKLPTYKEYTVDFKLRQFRIFNNKQRLIISFDTKQGQKLLEEILIYGFTKQNF
jgi:deoxycytidine triphosphate deaminase